MSTGKITSEIFGSRLSEVMKARGITQIALADAVGLAQSAISNYCNGRRILPMEEALKMAEVLEVPIQWLFAWKEAAECLRETFTAAGAAADAVPGISEDERQRLFQLFSVEPIALELEGIRVNAENLARRVKELQNKLFPPSKIAYKQKREASRAKADAEKIALEVSESLLDKKIGPKS